MPADQPVPASTSSSGTSSSGASPMAGVEPIPGVAKPDPILVVDHVSRSFGGLRAVDVDHLEVQRGLITSMIGPNGAGKTTLFNLLTGFDNADTGRWTVNGVSLEGKPPYTVARAGMVRTFQLTKALAKMTVIDNLMLGAAHQPGERLRTAMRPPGLRLRDTRWSKVKVPVPTLVWRAREAEVRERAEELMARFKLDHMRDQYAGTLSGGQRKLLEMARALMVDPAIILLDEPMAGVNPALVQSLLEHVRALRDEGTTVIFIEHDMDVVMGISDWVVCLAQGAIISEGLPQHVGSDPKVIDAYLGTQLATGADHG